jgi:hypothetical protein
LESYVEYESNGIILWHISHILLTKLIVTFFPEMRNILINRYGASSIVSSTSAFKLGIRALYVSFGTSDYEICSIIACYMSLLCRLVWIRDHMEKLLTLESRFVSMDPSAPHVAYILQINSGT